MRAAVFLCMMPRFTFLSIDENECESAGVATALALAAIAVWLLRQVDGGFSHAGHVAASAEWLLGMPMRSPKFWTLLSMPWFYDLRRDLVVAGFA